MQEPNGQLQTLQHALGEARELFDVMVRAGDPQMLSSIVVFGAVMEARGRDAFVGVVLSHTRAVPSHILGRGHPITLTIELDCQRPCKGIAGARNQSKQAPRDLLEIPDRIWQAASILSDQPLQP